MGLGVIIPLLAVCGQSPPALDVQHVSGAGLDKVRIPLFMYSIFMCFNGPVHISVHHFVVVLHRVFVESSNLEDSVV